MHRDQNTFYRCGGEGKEAGRGIWKHTQQNRRSSRVLRGIASLELQESPDFSSLFHDP